MTHLSLDNLRLKKEIYARLKRETYAEKEVIKQVIATGNPRPDLNWFVIAKDRQKKVTIYNINSIWPTGMSNAYYQKVSKALYIPFLIKVYKETYKVKICKEWED